MGIKEIRDNRARWDALIRIRVADEPDVKAYRVGKDLADLNSKLTEPIPADEPSQRTVDARVKYYKQLFKDDGAALEKARRVYFPETFESGLLPWDAVPYTVDLLRHYPYLQRADRSGRPTIRLAKWFYTLSRSAPSSPIGSRTTMAMMLALEEVAPEGKSSEWIKRVVEWWLIDEPWEKPEDFHANQTISPALLRADSFREHVRNVPVTAATINRMRSTDAELLEMGFTRQQYNQYVEAVGLKEEINA